MFWLQGDNLCYFVYIFLDLTIHFDLSCTLQKTEKGFPIKLDHLLAGGSSVPKNNLDFVNKLREYWHKGHNAVVFDDQVSVIKSYSFWPVNESGPSKS